jgi:hypothetical protein
MIPSKSEILEVARQLKEAAPSISREKMRELLTDRYVHGKPIGGPVPDFAIRLDYGSVCPDYAMHAMCSPGDWFRGLASIFAGVASWLSGDQENAIRQMIEGALTILY